MTKAEIEKRITEMEQELDSLKAQLHAPEKKTGWEKPNDSDTFYLLDEEYRMKSYGFLKGGRSSERCYHVGNCFNSLKLAENIARYQSLDLRIRRRIAEICEPNKLNRGSYVIRYNNGKIEVVFMCCIYATWRCDTEEHAKQIIEEFKDELLWYFTEFKDRMDG